MAQFTFICVDEDKCKTTMEFESIFLPHVVDKMEEFLKGTGFYFDELTFTKDDVEDDELHIEEPSTCDDDDVPGDPSY